MQFALPDVNDPGDASADDFFRPLPHALRDRMKDAGLKFCMLASVLSACSAPRRRLRSGPPSSTPPYPDGPTDAYTLSTAQAAGDHLGTEVADENSMKNYTEMLGLAEKAKEAKQAAKDCMPHAAQHETTAAPPWTRCSPWACSMRLSKIYIKPP